MLTNYLKVALRNLWKNKSFSLINIIGLAIGLATCLMIMVYVMDELSYDRYNENADRIYRIDSDVKFGNSSLNLAVTSDPMGQILKKDYPQVESYTRIYVSDGPKLVKKDNENILEMNVANVDSTFFNVFTFTALSGDTKTALTQPNTVVLTESMAKKYFGTTEVLGKTIEANQTPRKITAVIKDMPKNSHFNFDFLFPMADVHYGWGNFLNHNFQTYIVLRNGTDYKSFEKNFDQVTDKYILPQIKQFMQVSSMNDFAKTGNSLRYSLTPLLKIHLYSDKTGELGTNGNVQYVYIFSAIAFFVLLIACINFMNLSTARSANRAKEIGIRKVLGTERKSLIAQFIIESIITVAISLAIAVCLATMVLPLLNNISAKAIPTSSFLNNKILFFLIITPAVVGILAGSYPAFFLSRFKPVTVLKGNVNTNFKKSDLRNALVVFQFTISLALIISTIIVYSQLNFIQTKKIGYQKDQVLIVDNVRALRNNAEVFKNSVLQIPTVKSGTLSSFLPVMPSSRNYTTYVKEATINANNTFTMQTWDVDYDYIKTLGMEIIKGRDFSKDFASDSAGVIVNEATVTFMGYKDPIGKFVYAPDQNHPGATIAMPIIGVVRNFNFESLRQLISPLCLKLNKSTNLASFKINATDAREVIAQIEKKWKAIAPGMPFSYRFLSESFTNMYRQEQQTGKVALSFAIVAIIIACLGLFGLVTYMAEQRTREIGIRKVLGASATSVVSMLSINFLKLILMAILISSPIAWYFMYRWLDGFAYRIEIHWWVFVSAGLAALIIALITVSVEAIKAAMANPVKSLRSE